MCLKLITKCKWNYLELETNNCDFVLLNLGFTNLKFSRMLKGTLISGMLCRVSWADKHCRRRNRVSSSSR